MVDKTVKQLDAVFSWGTALAGTVFAWGTVRQDPFLHEGIPPREASDSDKTGDRGTRTTDTGKREAEAQSSGHASAVKARPGKPRKW